MKPQELKENDYELLSHVIATQTEWNNGETEGQKVKPKRVRIGKQMREILKVLDENGIMMITEIIMVVEHLRPFRTHIVNPRVENGELKYETVEKPWPPYIQQELDSAIAEKSVTWWMGGLEDVRKRVNKLYASFSRSIKILVEMGLVKSSDRIEGWGWKANRCRFYISEKGRETL